MQSSIEVVTPAGSQNLVSLADLKIALKITSTTEDALLNQLIERASAEVSTYTNRIFGGEAVVETITDIGDVTVIYLSHWPIAADGITSVTDGDGTVLVADTDYTLDTRAGALTRISGTWTEPVVVEYSGGYDLPASAPKALMHAAIILAKENYYAVQRGDATVRMISHKDSRIIYFDPNAANRGAQASSAGTAAQRAVRDLLLHYTRFEV
jgi:hypothetical protein